MIFEVNRKKCEGKMSLSMTDETYMENDKEITQTVAYLNLAIDLFLIDIEKIVCTIGVFKKIELINISIGTEDPHAVYSICSKDFSLNFGEIESMLLENKERIKEVMRSE